MNFVIGFLVQFTVGGLTGVVLANRFIDILVHDSYFIIGHFHFILSLGTVYSLFAGLMLFSNVLYITRNESMFRVSFYLLLMVTTCLLLPFHSMGITGYPRRTLLTDVKFSLLVYSLTIG